jgi:hypothetical protein
MLRPHGLTKSEPPHFYKKPNAQPNNMIYNNFIKNLAIK